MKTTMQQRYTAALKIRQAWERKQIEEVVTNAHSYAFSQTKGDDLDNVEWIEVHTIVNPNRDLLYFQSGSTIFSLHWGRFGEEIRKIVGCECFAKTDKESMELCLSMIYTYYESYCSYIKMKSNIKISPPYKIEHVNLIQEDMFNDGGFDKYEHFNDGGYYE